MVSHPASFIIAESEPTPSAPATRNRPTTGHPADWPGPGPIDLSQHDLPHASSTLEWWYVNSHLVLEGGVRVSVFAAFFRQLAPNENPRVQRYTHSIAWGLSAPDSCQYHCSVAVDSLAPEVGLRNLDAGVHPDDERVERAMREVLSRGRVPGPTQMLERDPVVAKDRLALDYSGNCFEKLDGGAYRLRLRDQKSGVECELHLVLNKAACRYGRDGVVHGVSGEQMFYYFVPRVHATGWVTIDGSRAKVIGGSAWYDHEFGFNPAAKQLGKTAPGGFQGVVRPLRPSEPRQPEPQRGETCWRWLSIQLDDHRELSTFFITRKATGEVLDRWTMLVHSDGETLAFDDTELETLETWRSTRTFVEYPISFRVRVPSAGVDLVARATFPDQEVVSVISDPAFWEGTVEAEGLVEGQQVRGRGWLECKGFGHASLDDFYASVGREVRGRLAEVLPQTPESPLALGRLTVRGTPGVSEPHPVTLEIDGQRLAPALMDPIRAIAERGGKGWRSYAALACIDVVGGDSRRFLHWLVMPEIVHVGSLIVDDVEDESSVRRGGPACHVLHGTATAINAGTAAYFLAEPPVDQDELPAETKLRIYRLYFDAMRAGHAGQALDLCDIRDLASAAADDGNIQALERHVLSVHRLKTAVPAAMFARAGALLGGGTEQQIESVGAFFEAIGLAFQIIDDVLNVSGFDRDLKERGEDVRAGKVTLPVVMALARLEPSRRRWFWQTFSAGCDDDAVAELCAAIAECGALEECRAVAHRLVEDAWSDLDRSVEDSQFKLMFRAFGWYVLERQY